MLLTGFVAEPAPRSDAAPAGSRPFPGWIAQALWAMDAVLVVLAFTLVRAAGGKGHLVAGCLLVGCGALLGILGAWLNARRIVLLAEDEMPTLPAIQVRYAGRDRPNSY